MKTIIFSFCLSILLLCGCQKNNSDDSQDITYESLTQSSPNFWSGDISSFTNEYFVNLVLYNDAYGKYFVPIIENTVKGNKSIAEELYSKGGITLINNYKSYMNVSRTCSEFTNFYLANDIDTTLMLDKKADIICSWALFMQKCPAFQGLNDNRNSAIFATVMETLKQESFRTNNPTNILVIAYNSALNIMKPKVLISGNISGRLTASEVMDCLGATLGGALAASSSLIRDFVNIINGTNLGWSGIKALSKSFLRTVANSNALGAAIGFGFCIAWETFF